MRQFWNIKTVWGDLSTENRRFNRLELGDYRMKSLKDNAYTEVGTGFDNIFKFFRIDLVWRFTPPTTPQPANVIQNTTLHDFGVFGSFKVQF